MTWVYIGNAQTEDKVIKSVKPGCILVADKHGELTESSTSLLDIGRRMVDLKRMINESQAFMASINMSEIGRVDGKIKELESNLIWESVEVNQKLEEMQIQLESLSENIERVQALENVKLIGRRIDTLNIDMNVLQTSMEKYVSSNMSALYKTWLNKLNLYQDRDRIKNIELERSRARRDRYLFLSCVFTVSLTVLHIVGIL